MPDHFGFLGWIIDLSSCTLLVVCQLLPRPASCLHFTVLPLVFWWLTVTPGMYLVGPSPLGLVLLIRAPGYSMAGSRSTKSGIVARRDVSTEGGPLHIKTVPFR